ncbi:MAG: GH92 family glycosyl hydrolase [Flavobacteriaceae bacterium]
MKLFGYVVLPFVLLLFGCRRDNAITLAPLTKHVNPFIGTDGPGNTYPGATVPFGMVQLSPDIGIPGWDRIAGYFYRDTIISGFSHTHLSGTGAGDLYDILVMPTNSKFSKKIEANNFKPFSRYSHTQENASPGYYQVNLLDYGINAEVTATQRTGIHRYTFPEDSLSQIHIDLGYALNWDAPTDTQIKVVNTTTIQGYRFSTGWAKNQRLYFEIQLSKPFKSYNLYRNDSLILSNEISGKNTKIVLNYSTKNNDTILLKTGLSTANIDGAHKSLAVEAPHFKFETYKAQADSIWNTELNKITVFSEDEDKKTVFYTMLYQSMLAPTLLSDHNNAYKGANDSVATTNGFNRYDTFSLWDTYRAAHPLYTIIHPKRTADFINSLLAHYNETGLLPVWSMQGNETNMMIGNHAIPVIVDAYFKGIRGFNADLAYQACKESAMANSRQLGVYKALGYIPIDNHHENWSVSKTLEYAYNDWGVAQLAKALGKTNDYHYFLNRSENWRNLYDPKSTFFRPKLENDSFISPFTPKAYTPYFCESNAWQYMWSVPQNIEGLINIVGKEAFEQKLDSMFTFNPLPTDKLPIFSTGMIGQYAHGNEPGHHVSYLYNYLGKPWKTQRIVRAIINTQYKNAPDGHCGNEDCGQMSSWYVLSALGFYPVNPAQGVYALGSPIFNKTIINLESGKQFVVETENNSDKNKYIQSVTLNGTPFNQSYITHQDIINGGHLIFNMGEFPNETENKTMAISSQIYN